MFEKIHEQKKIQLILGLIIGIFFGFLLQKGGATNYNIIINQLLLRDFTIIKIMLTAVITGMIGVYILKGFNKIKLHPKPFYLKGIVPPGITMADIYRSVIPYTMVELFGLILIIIFPQIALWIPQTLGF